MRDMDYRPQKSRQRKKVPESVLLETAKYIAAVWEKEMPGCTANDPPEKVQAMILDFMRSLKIQTVEDYEAAMTKDCGGISPTAMLPPPVKNVARKCRKPSREEAQRMADEEMKRVLFTDPIADSPEKE